MKYGQVLLSLYCKTVWPIDSLSIQGEVMIYAMFAMTVLTFFIGVLTVATRFSSVKNKKLGIKYYQLMEGANVPENITKTSRCFNNQFETPMLFYVSAVLYIVLSLEHNVLGIVLAWMFVGLRCVHAYIHLTYNNVVHRLSAFWLACLCILMMWVNLIVYQIN